MYWRARLLWRLLSPQPAAPLHCSPTEVIKSCRFLGRAEVALADTLTMLSGVPAGTPLWLPLARRDAGDAVSGQLQLRFVWEVTARSLLTIKLHALERVLAQRQEILAALQPVPPAVVRAWAPPDSGAVQAEAAERTARGGVMGAGVNLFGVDNELGMSGARLCGAGQAGQGRHTRAAQRPARRLAGTRSTLALAPPCLTPLCPSLFMQARAGRSSPARSPPRCWPATRTTTTGATWWPRCSRRAGSRRAAASWWRSGMGSSSQLGCWLPRDAGWPAACAAHSTRTLSRSPTCAPTPRNTCLPQRQRAAKPGGAAGAQGLPLLHHARCGAHPAAAVRCGGCCTAQPCAGAGPLPAPLLLGMLLPPTLPLPCPRLAAAAGGTRRSATPGSGLTPASLR